MNVVLHTGGTGFAEDEWIGARLVFGDGKDAPAASVTARDEPCAMVNIDLDAGRQDACVMKAVVRLNGNYAGVYATVVRAETIAVGQTVHVVR